MRRSSSLFVSLSISPILFLAGMGAGWSFGHGGAPAGFARARPAFHAGSLHAGHRPIGFHAGRGRHLLTTGGYFLGTDTPDAPDAPSQIVPVPVPVPVITPVPVPISEPVARPRCIHPLIIHVHAVPKAPARMPRVVYGAPSGCGRY